MSAQLKNAIAKCLAGIFGAAFFLAVALLLTGASHDCAKVASTGCPRGFVIDGRDLFFGVACFCVAAMALTFAVVIRKRLGGPLIGPWRHW